MESVLEYIMANYTAFLGGAIIILLAIIGSYADKTNFGQGKKKESDNDNLELDKIEENKILDRPINDLLNEKRDEKEILPVNNNENALESQEQFVSDVDSETQPQENIASQEPKFETTFEEAFDKFDKEFNELLPEKEVINDELLDEIESLSLDKTQKIDLNDIPEINDLELPKIKDLEPEVEDIWKF